MSRSNSEGSDTPDPACAQRLGGQHLRGIHQIATDLLPEPSGVGAGVPQPFSSVHPAVRSVKSLS